MTPSRPALPSALGPAALWIVVLLALAAAPLSGDAYLEQVGYRVLQLAALATAWNLLAGYGGLVSLGVASFVGVGAYALAYVGNLTGAPLWTLIPLGGLVAAAFAALASLALFRLRGLYFSVGTLALGEALRILMLNLATFGGASGIVLKMVTPATRDLYWLELGIALISIAAIWWALARPAALALLAVRDDEDVAREMGVDVFAAKFAAFTGAAFLIGLVGAVQALKLGSIEPTGAFGVTWTIEAVAATIIGGVGTRAGPLIGAVVYLALAEALRVLPEVHAAITGVILLLVIRFAPRGIWGTLSEWRAARLLALEAADG